MVSEHGAKIVTSQSGQPQDSSYLMRVSPVEFSNEQEQQPQPSLTVSLTSGREKISMFVVFPCLLNIHKLFSQILS